MTSHQCNFSLEVSWSNISERCQIITINPLKIKKLIHIIYKYSIRTAATGTNQRVLRGEIIAAWVIGTHICPRYWPGVAQRVPEGSGSQISWHSASEGGEVSLTHRPPLPPGMFLVLIFPRGWVDPRTMVRSEGNMSPKTHKCTVWAIWKCSRIELDGKLTSH